MIETDPQTNINDSLIKFSLNTTPLTWDNKNYRFIHNSGYLLVKNNFNDYLLILIEELSNTEATSAVICSYQQTLKKGDISFLLLNDLGKLPIYDAFNMQFDVYLDGCQYPTGLIEWLNENRSKVKREARQYLIEK